MFVPIFLGRQETWRTHAHTHKHRPWPSQRKILMCDCCCTVTCQSGELERRDTDRIGQQREKADIFFVGFPRSCEAQRDGTRSLEKQPARATLDAQSTRHRTWPGLIFCVVVYPRPPCVPRSREREKRHAAAGEGHANLQKNVRLALAYAYEDMSRSIAFYVD